LHLQMHHKDINIGLAHDMIVNRGGGERVLSYFHDAFPQAPIYTTAWKPDLSFPEFSECNIKTTLYNKLVYTDTDYKKYYFPMGLISAKNFRIKGHDVILQSTTHGSKYYKYNNNSFIISYCFTPFRLAWNPDSYTQYRESKGFSRALFNLLIAYLKRLEVNTAKRPDVFWAMNRYTADRIERHYGRQCTRIINPPVDCSLFEVSEKVDDYFLVISRLEYYKRVDLVIEAFNELGLLEYKKKYSIASDG